MLETRRFAELREGLGERLTLLDASPKAARAYLRARYGGAGLRRVLANIAPHHVAQARANLDRKLGRFPEIRRLGWLTRAYLRKKARHAALAEAMLRDRMQDLGNPVAIVYNGTRVPDSVLANVAGPGRRIFIENGYFKGTIQADAQGINDDNSLPRDPAFYRAYRPDDRPLDLMLDTRIPKHAVSDRIGLPPDYVFVPFQVDSDSQITLHSPWIGSMRALYDLVVEMAEACPERYFVIKEHPFSRRALHGRVREHPRIIFQNGRNTQELIDGAGAILTINSTVGVEALARGRPVIVLGRACYRIKGLVQTADSAAELREVLARIGAWTPDAELRANFLHYLYYHFLLRGMGMPDGRDAGEVLLQVLHRDPAAMLEIRAG